jgi:predicted secreted protein
MDPVDPVVQTLQTQRFREMSAERKLQLADELLDLARALKESSLRKLYPDLSEAALRARVTELFANGWRPPNT